jgi:hypothetical protein
MASGSSPTFLRSPTLDFARPIIGQRQALPTPEVRRRRFGYITLSDRLSRSSSKSAPSANGALHCVTAVSGL